MIVVGLSHRTTPIAVRERLAIPADGLGEALRGYRALEPVGEVLVLSTCNRVEVYAAPASPDVEAATVVRAITERLVARGGREVAAHLASASGDAAVLHLFRVAASLDSLVVGEPQILGQLKEAARAAQEHGTLGPELHVALRFALHVAKRARTETAVGAGQVSVPSVAVELAESIFEQLAGRVALLVGAGEMAETAARLLARGGARVMVINRSPERATELAVAVGGEPRSWTELERCLVQADIVVSSTASAEPVITRELVAGLRRPRRGRSLFLIDIAVPRDVDPAVNQIDNVYLYDIDDLSHVVARSLASRQAEAEHAESIVRAEARIFASRRVQQTVTPVIVGLRERVREVLHGELERSLRGRLKHLDDQDRSALAAMVDAAVNKLLHPPTARLKTMAEGPHAGEAVQLVRELFDLDDAIAAAARRTDPEILVEEVDVLANGSVAHDVTSPATRPAAGR